MNNTQEISFGRRYLVTALVMLMAALVFGFLASISYLVPDFMKETMGFVKLRPLHVSSALFWILLGGVGGIYYGLQISFPGKISPTLAQGQYGLWILGMAGIFISYFTGQFGGREYWEFEPIWALPIALSWILFIIQFFRCTGGPVNRPVYYWMWMTGSLFFLFTFTENYLWLFPYFRNALITDLTIQWKVNGSMVGAWNQLLYGVAFFLMDRISGNSNTGRSKTAFAVYFLGFSNLLFNWGHHIYTLPTAAYIRHFGYVVSMTEWILFIRIVLNWKQELTDAKKHFNLLAYRFILASNIWVFLNLGLALLISIPALNLHTHGTHVTVAHAMGTTIGINTMILLAAAAYFLPGKPLTGKSSGTFYWILQLSLLVFWITLIVAGLIRGNWQLAADPVPFATMMEKLRPAFIVLVTSGFVLAITLFYFVVSLFSAKPTDVQN